MSKFLLLLSISCFFVSTSELHAQYRNTQIGAEAGYQFIFNDIKDLSNSLHVGFKGGIKASDHWWFTARSLVSFDHSISPVGRNNFALHITPIDVRYYVWTDKLRPFIGVASSFRFIFRDGLRISQWGPGLLGGVEFKIDRDIFIGCQVDSHYLVGFRDKGVIALQATTQLIFFM